MYTVCLVVDAARRWAEDAEDFLAKLKAMRQQWIRDRQEEASENGSASPPLSSRPKLTMASLLGDEAPPPLTEAERAVAANSDARPSSVAWKAMRDRERRARLRSLPATFTADLAAWLDNEAPFIDSFDDARHTDEQTFVLM